MNAMISKQNEYPLYRLGEEIMNAITHGIGVFLSLVALVLLVVRAFLHAPPEMLVPYIVGFTVFGVSLILLYLMSTLYHSITHLGAKRVFCVLDHSAIFILIAGTYTGYCLSVLYGPVGWFLFGIIWGLAVIGITVHITYGNRAKWFSLGLYLVMGWLVASVIELLYYLLPTPSWYCLIFGGVAYTVGCIFFVMKRVPWMHAIWHLFVLAGSIFHFFSLYFLV